MGLLTQILISTTPSDVYNVCVLTVHLCTTLQMHTLYSNTGTWQHRQDSSPPYYVAAVQGRQELQDETSVRYNGQWLTDSHTREKEQRQLGRRTHTHTHTDTHTQFISLYVRSK